MKIYPVILSGGSGTRLWPLSRTALPKQFHAIVTEKTMFQETVLRVAGLPEVMQPLIVCGNEHRFLVAEQLQEIGVQPLDIILEPEGKDTAPAAAAAAWRLFEMDEEALMLLMPADHVITDTISFENAVRASVEVAAAGKIVTYGMRAQSAETGYGYIRSGTSLEGFPGCFAIAAFIEKPDRRTAEEMVGEGHYHWNSGMFLFKASTYLKELAQYHPAISSAVKHAVESAQRDLDFCRLDADAFSACPADSIDYAVMEKTEKGVVIPATMGWSDVGSWSSLSDTQGADDQGNVSKGDVYLDGVTNSLVRSESRLIAAIGLENVVIVETGDAVLVAHKDSVQRVKEVVKTLQKEGRCEHEFHSTVYRPWGSYQGIDAGDRFQVKRIVVKPGAKLSLQMHYHRAEHWVVVKGTARVTCGSDVKLISENESTYIPIGVVHRVENPGKVALHMIEVQSGSYLGEDDIVRLEDAYKRV